MGPLEGNRSGRTFFIRFLSLSFRRGSRRVRSHGQNGSYRVSAKYSWLSALLTAFFGLLVARRWQALVP